jgi:hypothetical protein
MRQLGPDVRRFKYEIEAMKRERRKRKLTERRLRKLRKQEQTKEVTVI